MTKIFLCSADFVRGLTNISNNVQDKFLTSALRETQDMDLTQVLGTKLVNKLCDLVRTGKIGEKDNNKYKELLDNAQFFMAYSTVAKLTLISTVKIDNAGAHTTSDVNMNPLQIKDVFSIEQYYVNKADYYKERLQDYCKENYKKIPELKSCGLYDVKPTLDSSASCPIFLGGARAYRKRKC